ANVQRAYLQCRQSGRILRCDLSDMGLRLPGYSWDTLNIWPTLPATEYEFWLYVVREAKRHGAAIPDFMESISDTSAIEDRVTRWERAREIQRWKNSFSRAESVFRPPASATPGQTDLRLVVGKQGAFFEQKSPGQETFEVLKPSQSQL